jgi:hypothetical protein
LDDEVMTIATDHVEPHWNYLLALERDVERISRYVEFHEDNFSCFSVELARILLAAGAETDVVAKQVCRAANAGSVAENILQYRDEIVPMYPRLAGFTLLLPRFGLTLKPWDEWTRRGGVPIWWTAYNKTKHERHSEFKRANLKNALNAVGGLLVMVLYLYKGKAQHGHLLPATQLFRPDADYFGGAQFSDHEFGTRYLL